VYSASIYERTQSCTVKAYQYYKMWPPCFIPCSEATVCWLFESGNTSVWFHWTGLLDSLQCCFLPN